MSDLELEPASFRDPASTVAYLDGRVLRGLTKEGAEDFGALASAPFFEPAMTEGRLVRTTEVPLEDLPQSVRGDAWVLALEHERIPFVTYPYEWTFSMLKDAALVHLDLLLAALGADLTMKDGYAYNLAFVGARPVFIDVGSFERVRPGEPWAGYRQFCQTMLYPLLLQAHKDIRFQPWLRGQVQGIQPQELARLFSGTDRLRSGVLKHVTLHGAMDQRYSGSRAQDTQKELKAAGFSTELQKATVAAIRKLVSKLDWSRSASEWKDYQHTSTYTDAERQLKAAFVERALEGRGTRLLFDLGGNDGTYSRVAARHADYVVCADGDDLCLDGLYRALKQEGNAQILGWWSSSSTRPTRWRTACWPTNRPGCTATTAERSSSACWRPASTWSSARSSLPAPGRCTTRPRAAPPSPGGDSTWKPGTRSDPGGTCGPSPTARSPPGSAGTSSSAPTGSSSGRCRRSGSGPGTSPPRRPRSASWRPGPRTRTSATRSSTTSARRR